MNKDNISGQRIAQALEKRGMRAIELADRTGISRGAISSYISGRYKAKQDNLYKMGKALGVSPAWLMGYDVDMNDDINDDYSYLPEYLPIAKKKIPLLGTIAAGQPIYAEEHIEEYLPVKDNIHADFALKIKGDSMINANINDGDIVFIRKQNDVDDGQIAAVLIDDSATLKRVYHNGNELQLWAENPKYKPITCNENTCDCCKIIGIAVAVLSKINN